MFGIQGIEIYFPKTYVDQSEYQTFKNVGKGKYTKGLGQLQLSFAGPSEDVNSISLTVVSNLLRNYNIHPSQVGRLEVGTETLVDKSKSTKTVLMSLFKGNHDIEGATSINACYGATNALINTLNWISSPYWDGRYGIVVAADLAVYEDGPARCTGGAGAVAILIGPNGKITFNKERATFIDHAYDFYKPIPSSEYPTVDGKLSIDCYLKAVEECYSKLKSKCRGKNLVSQADFICFHSPFYKMVQKAYTHLHKQQAPNSTDEEINGSFNKKVHPTLHISQRIGNIYTGSLFSCLISLLISDLEIKGKNAMLFSYGSGLCSTMFSIKIHSNPLSKAQIENVYERLQNRVKISPEEYTRVMLERQSNFGVFRGTIKLEDALLDDNVFYLSEIDEKWRRKYEVKNPTPIQINKKPISAMERLENLNKSIDNSQFAKFYKLPVGDRLDIVSSRSEGQVDRVAIQSGGLSVEIADTMIENVIGKLSLPLAVVPSLVINNKTYMVPMCIEEPSVVAACSSVGKFLAPYSFFTSSTPNVMIGQLHLPEAEVFEVHKIVGEKKAIIQQLNKFCSSMVQRGGGVVDLRIRELKGPFSKQYSVDIFINVCQAMGANITNSLCEKTKEYISKMGIKTGIAILTNYCSERRALSYFELPVKDMGWKGVPGAEVAEKILEAFEFARVDPFRAATHNKGIMNGIDSVCVATGQDWRAVESAAHVYAARGKQYSPLTSYQLVERDGEIYFHGSLQLPIAVGTRGGVIQKSPLYKQTLGILGNPSAQELAEVLVTVGLAQNFAALRALAIEGINKGHMVLHARSIAQKAGVPKHLIEEACRFMALRKKYDSLTALEFLKTVPKAKL